MQANLNGISDDYDEISSHVYSSENIPGVGCNLEQFETQICNTCKCFPEDCCPENNCSCIKLSHGVNYELYRGTKTVSNTKLNSTPCSSYSIFECNQMCSCSNFPCINRLVQFGPRKSLYLKSCPQKGLCLFTSLPILKGEFICEYAGEIISRAEAKRRLDLDSRSSKMNYIFFLRENFTNEVVETIVDPSSIGNIGRYINHSCSPNAAIIPVRVDSVVPKLAIFAKSDIMAEKEITMSYSTGASSMVHSLPQDLKPCNCLEENCVKYLPNDNIF
nr:PREDICTED: histone-lysine N-methyltransferase SETMAR-like isoform X2 [Bemisia tabaci]